MARTVGAAKLLVQLPVTEGALEVVRQKGYGGAAKVLPLAIDRKVYRPNTVWAAAKRAELAIGEDEFVMGYLGRLVEEKGLDAMLHGAQVLKGQTLALHSRW